MQNDDARIASLERQLGLQRWMCVLTLALACCPWILGMGQEPGDATSPMRSLTIVDAEGKPILVAEPAEKGGASLVLFNAEHEPMLELGADDEGQGALELRNAKGKTVLFLGASEDHAGGVRVESKNGQPINYMGADLRGNGRVPKDVLSGLRVF